MPNPHSHRRTWRRLGSAAVLAGLPLLAAVPSARASETGRDDRRAKDQAVSTELARVAIPRSGPVEALGCTTPCTAGLLPATHPWYDVFVACMDGDFTGRTGPQHPITLSAGRPQNLLFGGAAGAPGTSHIALRVHNNDTSYIAPSGAGACMFDPPDTPSEPASIGLEAEWSIDPGVAGLVPLVLRQEVVAFGTTDADAGLRFTLGVTNPAGSTVAASIGLRWELDHANGRDDGPDFSTISCSPFGIDPARTTEHELLPAEIKDWYRVQNDDGSSPVYALVVSTSPVAGFPDTRTPDRLVFGSWASLANCAWDYVAVESQDARFDSDVLYYIGYLPSSGITIAPGETVTRSIVALAMPTVLSCPVAVPGACIVSSLSPILGLKGAKEGSAGARFEWLVDSAEEPIEYHLDTVTAKTSLLGPDVHLPLASLQCTAISPATACSDADAITDGAQLFYQVFSACGPSGADEGPR